VGILWTILIPAVNAIVYSIIFEHIMKVQIQNYPLFILAGILPWSFFSSSITNGMECLVANHSVLNKVPIPAFSFILAEVLTAFCNFILSLPTLILLALIYGIDLNIYSLAIPIGVLLLLLQSYGISVILGYTFVFFRDLRFILSIVLQIWFYLTPVLYSAKMIPPNMELLSWLNPVGIVFHLFHESIGFEGVGNKYFYMIPFVWTILLLIVAFFVIKKFNQRIVESL